MSSIRAVDRSSLGFPTPIFGLCLMVGLNGSSGRVVVELVLLLVEDTEVLVELVEVV